MNLEYKGMMHIQSLARLLQSDVLPFEAGIADATLVACVLDGEAMKLILDRSADVGCYRWSNAR